MAESIETVQCVDADGNEEEVLISTMIREQRMLSGDVSVHRGLKEARLRDGSAVVPVGDDAFRVVNDGRILRRI